jgi:hypothetical protein
LLESIEHPNARKIHDALAETTHQTLRAGQIIRQLREFVARGETEKRLENINKLVEEASVLALVGAKEQGVKTIFRFDPRTGPVLVEKVQIQQVLLNLIRNAIEAMQGCPRKELVVETVLVDQGMVEVKRCLQCDRPLWTWTRPSYGAERRFCSEYCQRRYLGDPTPALSPIPSHRGCPQPQYASPLPDIAENGSPAGGVVCAARVSHRETDDDAYPAVAQLSDTARVICADDLQWILQRRSGGQWRGVSFCRTRAALIPEARSKFGLGPEPLLSLPERHDG